MCTSDILSCIVGVRIPDRSPLPVLESNTHFTSGDSLWQTRLVDTQSFDTTHIYTDPRNMEPPEDQSFMKQSSFIVTSIFVTVYILNGMQIRTSYDFHTVGLRLRGGMDNPSLDEKSNEVPYLKNIKFFWNGLPCIDFSENIMFPLENGLASITVKGYSLLDACRQTDAGGVLGNPARAFAQPDVVAESIGRNHKAFAVILNYTLRSSWFYKMSMREFPSNGIAVLRAIRIYGTIPLPRRIAQSREDTWNRMSMEVLHIPFDQLGYYKWMDIVIELGRKLNKNGQMQLDKFIFGLPAWFTTEKTAMRHDTAANLLFPPNWGGLFPGAPNAANPHPLRGQPNVTAFAKKYFSDWCIKSHVAGKDKLDSFIKSVEHCETIDDHANLIKWHEIHEKTKCYFCNGDGHAARQEMPDGTVKICASKALQDEKDAADGNKHKQRFKDQAKQIEELQTELAELNAVFSTQHNRKPRYPRDRRYQKPGSAHSSEECDDAEEESDDQSSDGSTVPSFAEAVHPSRKQKMYPKRKP